MFHTSRASADWIGRYWSRVGAAVIGRTLFDYTGGWGGRPVVGSGRRFFGDYQGAPALLGDPYDVVTGDRITHLRYRVGA